MSLPLLVLGLFIFSLGIVFTLHSSLGLGPWDVLHQGLSGRISLTFGQTSILVGGVLILITVLLGERPGLGTVLNMVLIGLFVDAIQWTRLVPEGAGRSVVVRFAMDVGGVAAVGAGSALYIKAGLGAGPRDSLMLGLHRHTGLRVGWVRTAIEVSALIVGYLLGGTVGVGTAIFALGIGPAVDAAFRLFDVHPHPPPTDRRSSVAHSPTDGV